MIVKTAEGEKIAEFELSFSEGEEFGTDVTEKGVSITYTRSTETVDIEVKLIPDQSGATISEVSGSDIPQTSDALGGIGSALYCSKCAQSTCPCRPGAVSNRTVAWWLSSFFFVLA